MADKTATFGIKVDAVTNADAAASSVEKLKLQIEQSQEAARKHAEALKGLRGTSDEVKAAVTKLKSARDAERDSISRASLALLKQGTSYAEVAKKAKATTLATEEMKKKQAEAKKKADELAAANMRLSGPLKSLVEGFTSFSEKLGTTGGLMSLATTAALGLVAAAVAVGGAIFAAGVKLASFILESGNALRTMGLFREAATGSASNAKAFGNQIEAMGRKVPQTREELQGLSVELSRSLVGTRLTGQGIVDTFKLVSQESAAMGDSAGKALQGIVERSKTFGRLSLGLYELQGTGLEFTDVANALAKNLGIGNAAAQQQLRLGLVNVNAGAAAIKDAVEKKFGAINARRLLDLNVQAAKFKDKLTALTRGINLEPILKSVEKLANMFDTSTVTGTALKGLLERFADAAGKGFEKAVPIMQEYFETALIYSLKFELAMRKLDAQIDLAFGEGTLSKIGAFLNPLRQIEQVFKAIGFQIDVVTNLLATLNGVGFAKPSGKGKADEVKERLAAAGVGKDNPGKALGDGFAKGAAGSGQEVDKAVKGLAGRAKDRLAGDLQIHSPSKVFQGFGRNTARGFAEGVDDGAGGVAKSVGGMAMAGIGAATGGGGIAGKGGINVGEFNLHLELPNVKDGQEMKAAMSAPEFRAAVQRMLVEMLISVGGAA